LQKTCASLLSLFISARPDPVTIDYFATVASICTGADNDHDDNKGDKLADIMLVLAMSEHELDKCTDAKSIRITCRNIVRALFKKDLADHSVQFGTLLKCNKKKKVIAAIRGRLIDSIFNRHLFSFLQIMVD
jgi:hypothetical protein